MVGLTAIRGLAAVTAFVDCITGIGSAVHGGVTRHHISSKGIVGVLGFQFIGSGAFRGGGGRADINSVIGQVIIGAQNFKAFGSGQRGETAFKVDRVSLNEVPICFKLLTQEMRRAFSRA